MDGVVKAVKRQDLLILKNSVVKRVQKKYARLVATSVMRILRIMKWKQRFAPLVSTKNRGTQRRGVRRIQRAMPVATHKNGLTVLIVDFLRYFGNQAIYRKRGCSNTLIAGSLLPTMSKEEK